MYLILTYIAVMQITQSNWRHTHRIFNTKWIHYISVWLRLWFDEIKFHLIGFFSWDLKNTLW